MMTKLMHGFACNCNREHMELHRKHSKQGYAWHLQDITHLRPRWD